MLRYSKLILLALTVSVSVAGDARATESPGKALARGNQLFAAGRYAEAFEVYEAANTASASPVFLRSMAFCKLKLSQHKQAHELFRHYLQKYPREKDAAQIASTVKDLDVVVQTTVSVKSTPPGARLFFDIQAAGSVGTTPYDSTIEPGKHVAILQLPGYQTTTRAFTVLPRKRVELEVDLEVSLRISSTPAAATVHVGSPDSPAVGKTPYSGGIVPGRRKIFLRLPGYKTWSREVDIHKDTPPLVANLQLGMQIASVPPGAAVEIDGTRVEGVTPLEVEATPGQHTVTVLLEGFRPHTSQIVVSPGQTNAVEVRLEGGLLTMRSGPDGAAVRVGRHDLGTTPIDRAPVPMGSQPITVTHPERRTWERALDFSDTELLTADIKLGRSSWPAWTSAGVAVASLTVGIVAGLIASSKVSDANDTLRDDGKPGICNADGTVVMIGGEPVRKANGDPVTDSDCGYGVHHASTAGFVTAGVAGAFSLLYYLLAVRPDEDVARKPRTTTSWW